MTVALQDAANIGAGVQGDVGCSLDQYGQPQPPSFCGLSLPVGATDGAVSFGLATNNSSTALANGDGDTITIASGDSNVLVVGDGANDVLTVGSTTGTGGNNNVLVAGNGDGDHLTVGAGDGTGGGNNNLLEAGNGANDELIVNNGDGNILVVGGGANASLSILGTGSNNELFAGGGAGDSLFVNTGDNNVLHAGSGAGDTLLVGTGDNNDLLVANGTGDQVLVLTGDNNCLTVGGGDNDFVQVGTGNSNDLEAGSGANDNLTVDTGDNNLLNAGNGANDFLTITGTGDHNTLNVGDGLHDVIIVGTGNYNLLHAGNGAGDQLLLESGNFNALIAGNGDGDNVTVAFGDNNIMAVGNGVGDQLDLTQGNTNTILDGDGLNDTILVGGMSMGGVDSIGAGVNADNNIVIGNGNGDQAWGSLGNGNNYMTGAGNDLVHTGGGNDFVYEDNHTETSTPLDPFHLTSTDSLAQNLFADSGSDTFALQGTVQNSCHNYSHCSYGHTYQTAVTFSQECHQVGASDPGLGTTVITGHDANANLAAGTTGAEKYWVSGLWGSLVVTDFNSADGDRIMMGGVSDPNISNLGPVHFQYINSAYDAASTGNADLDLLITFGAASNAPQQSIELLDYKPQDTGGVGGAMLFNNVTFNDPQAAEAALSHIFDFSAADNAAVTSHIASLAAQNLVLH